MSNQDSPTPPAPAEVCELLTKLILDCYQYPILEEQQEAVRQAIALISQGEKERERLDWLDKHRNWWAPRRHVDGYEQISRAAIDAAIDAARAQPTPESK